jgi:uncharacterized BrkB/YihY/UPF0761 family membrane protein
MSPQQKSQRRERRRASLMGELRRRFSEHELPIYASAIAFRALISVIPLTLLGLGLLGGLGLQDTWHNSIAPAIKRVYSRRSTRASTHPSRRSSRAGRPA